MGLCRLRAGHELVALRLELVKLAAHLVEAVLELGDHLFLRGDERLGVLRLLLGGNLLRNGDFSQVVELRCVLLVARQAHLLGLVRRREGFLPPLAGGLDVLLVVGLGEPEVAHGHGHGVLRLGDRIRVVADHLVEHLLRILGPVEQGVDVRLGELGDPSQDRLLLSHICAFR